LIKYWTGLKLTAMWNNKERSLLDNILNEIVPASEDGRMPAAGDLGVGDFLSKRMEDTAGLKDLFDRGLAAAERMVSASPPGNFSVLDPDTRVELLEELEKAEPDFFFELVRYTYMGYYTNPKIPPCFGLSEKPPQPEGYEIRSEEPPELDRLLESVINRGEIYRRS
jgi:hypothetical protein